MMVRVLVVDDEADLLLGIAESLSQDGFEVVTAIDTSSARLTLSRISVDILCLDVDMPDGDGLDFLQEIRLTAPDIPAIVMSGNASTERRLRAAQLGVESFLAKPFGFRKLKVLVKQYGEAIEENQSRSVTKTKKHLSPDE
jgi:DNA-binding NtrC family response regulator